MDKTLERILALVPKKPNGDYVHGALKEFASSIGLKSGNVISDWVSGKSSSYKSKLYEIAAVYGVSIEWLKGETDEKSATGEPVAQDDPVMMELYSIIRKMSVAEKLHLLEKAKQIIEI